MSSSSVSGLRSTVSGLSVRFALEADGLPADHDRAGLASRRQQHFEVAGKPQVVRVQKRDPLALRRGEAGVAGSGGAGILRLAQNAPRRKGSMVDG